jgi:choline dehydrogenase-like flavoprotein
VLLVERGRPVHHGKDYIGEGQAPWQMDNRGQLEYEQAKQQYWIQRKCYAFYSATKHFFVNDREQPYQTAEGKPFDWIRGNQLGGKSLLWHRQSYRWSDLDFTANSKDGYGVDWPLRYADLAPWYSHVEKFIGVSGSRENIAVLPDSEYLPPFEMNAVEKFAKQKIEARYADRKLIMGRCAHLSEPTQFFLDQGRYKCMARNECQRGCSFGAYFSTLSSTLPAALKTNNLKIACHSVVHSVSYDDKTGRATGVNIIDEQTLQTREYKARMIFLCASTLGTAQIMLNSTSSAFPTGIANTSGAVGHYLMDHVYNAGAVGEIEGFADDYYKGRRPTGIYMPRFRNVHEQNGKYLRGYAIFGGAFRGGWQRGDSIEKFGKALKHELRQPGPWSFSLKGSGEMLPRFENSASLHQTLKDKWGMPQLVMDCQFSDNEKKMMADIADTSAEMLELIGAKQIKKSINDWPPGLAIHELGTARMGKDPHTSVLNAYNQSHDVPNLFVTDGASFASSGWQNPSLTMMALTARAVDHAVEQYRSKKI